jgi:hypothetical protein
MKSSLKTFLAGESPYTRRAVLDGAVWLSEATDGVGEEGCWEDLGPFHKIWNIDVLDDGTAITYCAEY